MLISLNDGVSHVLTGQVKVGLETLTLELVAQTATRKRYHWGSSCKLEAH